MASQPDLCPLPLPPPLRFSLEDFLLELMLADNGGRPAIITGEVHI